MQNREEEYVSYVEILDEKCAFESTIEGETEVIEEQDTSEQPMMEEYYLISSGNELGYYL